MTRSALGWLNLISPKDGAGRRVAQHVAFGPHPRHRLDVYAPREFDAAVPTLLFVYGGGWDSGTKDDYEFAGRAYASAGFVTIIADYRVVPEAHFPDFLEDGAQALNWISGHAAAFGGDPDRIFIMGHSAGAYNAAMLGLDPVRFGADKAAGSIRAVVGLSGAYDFHPFKVPAAVAAFSRAPDPERTQPAKIAGHGAPPFYLGHGSRDVICGPYNTINLAARLRAKNVPVVERHFPGLGHPAPLLSIFPMLRWRAPVFRETVAFMHKYANQKDKSASSPVRHGGQTI